MAKKKWTAISLSMLLILSLVVSAGTFALFTGEATNANNSFHAGIIDLGTSPNPMYYTEASHRAGGAYDIPQAIPGGEAEGGWAPGDSIDREMVITNSGSLDAIVKGVHASINIEATPGGVTGLDQNDLRYQQFIDKMSVTISNRTAGDKLLFSGSLRQLLNADSGGDGGVEFDLAQQFIVGEPHTIDFNVAMALDANNDLQGVTWVFDFVFYAEQLRNNEPAEQMGYVEGSVRDSVGAIEGAVVDFGNGYAATTNNDGMYSIELPIGTYSATASMNGYHNSTVDNIPVQYNQTTTQNFLLEPVITDGTASGKITNSLDSTGVSGLNIVFRNGSNQAGTATTGANGLYNVTLPAGSYTGHIDGQGFISTSFPVVVTAGTNTPEQDATVTPDLNNLKSGETRVELTWTYDMDIDAHLFVPTTSGARPHIYYSNKNAAGASLDHDGGYWTREWKWSLNPFPGYWEYSIVPPRDETITINVPQRAGNYDYYVNKTQYRNNDTTWGLNSGTLKTQSGAKVKIYRDDLLVAEVDVNSANGQDNHRLWHVFTMNGNNISIKNNLSNGNVNNQGAGQSTFSLNETPTSDEDRIMELEKEVYEIPSENPEGLE